MIEIGNQFRLTVEDINYYEGIKGGQDKLEELESWDIGVPLEIYKTKAYKGYKQPYSQVIFESVVDNIRYHRQVLRELKVTELIYFEDLSGIYRGNLAESTSSTRLTNETFDSTTLGKEQFIDFVTHTVETILQESLKVDEDTDLDYVAYLDIELNSLADALWEPYVADFMEMENTNSKDFVLKIVKDTIDKLVKGKDEATKQEGDRIYSQLEAYTDLNYGVTNAKRFQVSIDSLEDEDIED